MSTLRRTTAFLVPDNVSAVDVIGYLGGTDIVVIDLDNTLVPDGAANDHVEHLLAAARQAASDAGIGRLIAISNGSSARSTGRDGVVWQVNKPFTRRSRLGIGSRASIAVIGDRILIDGLLAWRWNAPVFLTTWSPEVSIPRQRLVRAWAAWVQRRLFTTVTLGPAMELP